MVRICWGFFYGSTVFRFKWSVKKHCVANVLLAIWEIICTDLVANIFLSFFFVLSYKPKKESGFQQVEGLVTRNISVILFIESCALLQSHAYNTMPKQTYNFNYFLILRTKSPLLNYDKNWNSYYLPICK